MTKKLEKWWLEWDPVNKWLQIGGHVRLPDGHYDQWLTSPITVSFGKKRILTVSYFFVQTVYGSHLVETVHKSKYSLGKPTKLEKWLVPHVLKTKFKDGKLARFRRFSISRFHRGLG